MSADSTCALCSLPAPLGKGVLMGDGRLLCVRCWSERTTTGKACLDALKAKLRSILRPQ